MPKRKFENSFYYRVFKLSLFLKIKTKFTIKNMFLGCLRQILALCSEFGPLLALSSLEMCNKGIYAQKNQALINISKCCLIKTNI